MRRAGRRGRCRGARTRRDESPRGRRRHWSRGTRRARRPPVPSCRGRPRNGRARRRRTGRRRGARCGRWVARGGAPPRRGRRGPCLRTAPGPGPRARGPSPRRAGRHPRLTTAPASRRAATSSSPKPRSARTAAESPADGERGADVRIVEQRVRDELEPGHALDRYQSGGAVVAVPLGGLAEVADPGCRAHLAVSKRSSQESAESVERTAVSRSLSASRCSRRPVWLEKVASPAKRGVHDLGQLSGTARRWPRR